jgi:hypothetical protein
MTKKLKHDDANWFDALKWRCIGPPRGGRVVAVAGDPVVIYFVQFVQYDILFYFP